MLAVPRVEGRARLLVLRRLVRLCHLRGRHRPLLGALARARISELRRQAPAGGRHADPRARTRPASAGSTNTSCSARSADAWPSCARSRTGTSAIGWPRPRAWPKSRASAASSSSISVVVDPQPPAGTRHSARRGPRRDPREQHATSAAARSSSPRPNSWCAAAATSRASPISSRSSSRASGGTPVLLRDVARVELGARRAPRHRRAQRRRRGRQRHRAAALRRKRADRHRQHQGAARPRSPPACPKARRSCRSTTARS